MTDRARIRIAAVVTALFLAGVSAIGFAARRHAPVAGPAAPAAAVVQQPAAAPLAQPASDHEDEGDEHDVGEEHEVDD